MPDDSWPSAVVTLAYVCVLGYDVRFGEDYVVFMLNSSDQQRKLVGCGFQRLHTDISPLLSCLTVARIASRRFVMC